jgi:hypothetical protein
MNRRAFSKMLAALPFMGAAKAESAMIHYEAAVFEVISVESRNSWIWPADFPGLDAIAARIQRELAR